MRIVAIRAYYYQNGQKSNGNTMFIGKLVEVMNV